VKLLCGSQGRVRRRQAERHCKIEHIIITITGFLPFYCEDENHWFVGGRLKIRLPVVVEFRGHGLKVSRVWSDTYVSIKTTER